MVGLHLLNFELLGTTGAETSLSLIGGELLSIGEGAEREDLLLTGEEVGIEAPLVGHVVIENEACDLLVDGSRIILKLVDSSSLRKWHTADYNTGSVVYSRKSFLRFFSWTRKIANAKMSVCYVLNYCLNR